MFFRKVLFFQLFLELSSGNSILNSTIISSSGNTKFGGIAEIDAMVAALEANPLTEQMVSGALHNLDQVWDELFPAEQARIVKLLVDRVIVHEDDAPVSTVDSPATPPPTLPAGSSPTGPYPMR